MVWTDSVCGCWPYFQVVLDAGEGGLRLQLPGSAESLSLPVLEYGAMHSVTHHDLSGHSWTMVLNSLPRKELEPGSDRRSHSLTFH